MIVSFFVHNLDQDWKNGAYRQFLDYEPGIHYPHKCRLEPGNKYD